MKKRTTFEHHGQRYEADPASAGSIAIEMDFDGPQPNHFGAKRASRKALELGGFVGRTKRGGSCNVDVLQMTPHCNGTHTESISHIVNEEVWVGHAVTEPFCLAVLITTPTVSAKQTQESYRPALEDKDRLVTAEALARSYASIGEVRPDALILRTLPNTAEKTGRAYASGREPAFLTVQAMEWIVRLNCRHLLVDLPSVDRMYDDGLLTNHHLFWRVPEGSHALAADSQQDKTITEMVYVQDEWKDGVYLLNLQVPAFCSDAAPSRPLIMPAKRVAE